MKSTNYDKEMAEVKDLVGQGFKLREVAEITGIPYGTISCRLFREKAREAKAQPVKEQIATPVKEKTLDDFTPREIFKHLHNLGYRVEGRIYAMTKSYVNLQSMINE